MLILSDLSREEKKLLDTPNGIHTKTKLRQKLLVPGQVKMNNLYYFLLTELRLYLQESNGFDINEFISEQNLFKFSFVRHPFERYNDQVTMDL